MTRNAPRRTTTHRGGRIRTAALLVAVAGTVVTTTHLWPSGGPVRPAPPAAGSAATQPAVVDALPRVLDGAGSGSIGPADGVLPAGATVHDDDLPGVAGLDPALLDALRRATADAAADGVRLEVNSGWRSPAYQEQLLREAVAEHGSAAEAARWVATAETSAHVSGDAVDVGPPAAAQWLAEHGARYGLCPVYRNEPWHVELRPDAVDGGCPPVYADPTQDPRMHGRPGPSRNRRPVGRRARAGGRPDLPVRAGRVSAPRARGASRGRP
ncbi:M15 family metallopeptidase [uncultured Modestobacter sp.]|uniref:M15 family metallopeptidase n=1 Tax=uncultured Modestobacter sp. TaxID=380048 RepID=UPI00261A2329|nr:M15 family metallopeptidase [uncultured Modestobacter sp.]